MRTRTDLCPGALRPWPAADGLLVRLRLIGGRVSSESLRSLARVAEEYADGRVRVTGRANLQVRAFARRGAALAPEALAALEATGLLPSRSHELVRNVMASPGFDDALLDELDRRLCADPALAGLSARFLFVLDGGAGDLVERSCDLGLVVLGDGEAQLRIGEAWGPVLPLADAPRELVRLAAAFVAARGSGPSAPWHVHELAADLAREGGRVPRTADFDWLRHTTPTPDPRVPAPTPPPPYDERHLAVPEEGLDRAAIEELTASVDHVVVTPWRGVLVPAPSHPEESR